MGSMDNMHCARFLAEVAGYSWNLGPKAEAEHRLCLRQKAAEAEHRWCLRQKAVVDLANSRRPRQKAAEEVRCNCMERWAGTCSRQAKKTRWAEAGPKKKPGLWETGWRKKTAAEGTRRRAEQGAEAAAERGQCKG